MTDSVTYTLSEDQALATRSSDGAVVPWDDEKDQPLDIDGGAGRTWREHGAPSAIHAAPPAPPGAPDGPTLSDWRVGLDLWGAGRLAEVTTKIQELIDTGSPLGRVARQRFEYANNVYREDLMALKGALGFTDAEVEESLWRASRAAVRDYSGSWPLPTT